ncbi:MAG: class I SAM-dependent methyltransferase [Myxococcota bacterium]
MSTPSQSEPLAPEVLADLEAWTRLSGWYRLHIKAVQRYYRALGEPRPFRVVDVGCGLGGLLEEIAIWADSAGMEVQLTGVDPSPALVAHAQERLGVRAMIRAGSLLSADGPPQRYDLATATLVLNQLSGPDRLRLLAELGRAAQTAYVFDVTPTVAGEMGARLIPWLTGLGQAPPTAWIRTLERAPTVDEVVKLVAHLPVQVSRVFPSAVATHPEPRRRVKVDSDSAERAKIEFRTPKIKGAVVGSG